VNPQSIFAGPALVVIDAERKTYARYFGRKHTMTVQGEEALSPEEVEMFRANPFKFMGMETA
jgi:hypothetical protein